MLISTLPSTVEVPSAKRMKDEFVLAALIKIEATFIYTEKITFWVKHYKRDIQRTCNTNLAQEFKHTILSLFCFWSPSTTGSFTPRIGRRKQPLAKAGLILPRFFANACFWNNVKNDTDIRSLFQLILRLILVDFFLKSYSFLFSNLYVIGRSL